MGPLVAPLAENTLLSLIVPAAIGAAGSAINTAAQPDPYRPQSFGNAAIQQALQQAQQAATRQLEFTESRLGAQPFFPSFDTQGMVGNINVPGLDPGLNLGIQQGTVDLINSPLGGPPLTAPPGPGGTPPGGPGFASTDTDPNDRAESDERMARERGEFEGGHDPRDFMLGSEGHRFSSAEERERAVGDIAIFISKLQKGIKFKRSSKIESRSSGRMGV